MIQSYRDLSVWQKAMSLAERVYSSTEGLSDRLLSETSEVGRC